MKEQHTKAKQKNQGNSMNEHQDHHEPPFYGKDIYRKREEEHVKKILE